MKIHHQVTKQCWAGGQIIIDSWTHGGKQKIKTKLCALQYPVSRESKYTKVEIEKTLKYHEETLTPIQYQETI